MRGYDRFPDERLTHDLQKMREGIDHQDPLKPFGSMRGSQSTGVR